MFWTSPQYFLIGMFFIMMGAALGMVAGEPTENERKPPPIPIRKRLACILIGAFLGAYVAIIMSELMMQLSVGKTTFLWWSLLGCGLLFAIAIIPISKIREYAMTLALLGVATIAFVLVSGGILYIGLRLLIFMFQPECECTAMDECNHFRPN